MDFAAFQAAEKKARKDARRNKAPTSGSAAGQAAQKTGADAPRDKAPTPTSIPKSPPPPRLSAEEKGKRVDTGPSNKRDREEFDPEEAARRSKKGVVLKEPNAPRGTNSSSGRTRSTPSSPRSSAGTGSKYTWLAEGFRLPAQTHQLERLARDIEKATPPLKNLQLRDTRYNKYFGKVVLNRAADGDFSQVLHAGQTEVDSALGQIGSHIAEACSLVNYVGKMAASANTAKTLQIAVETEKLKLESQLATRNSELDAAAEKLRSAEENLAMVIAEKDKQTGELNSFKRANEDIKKQAAAMEKKLREVDQERRSALRQIEEMKSPSYFEKMVKEYKESPQFKDDVFKEAFEYFNRGCLHAFRNLHQFVPSKKLMKKIYEGVYTDLDLRSGSDFVPFNEKELTEIAARDQREGRSWNPPPPIHPNFEELCDLSDDEWEEEVLSIAVNDEVAAPEGELPVAPSVVAVSISATPEVPGVDLTEVLPSIPEVPEDAEVEAIEVDEVAPTAAAIELIDEFVTVPITDPPIIPNTELATPVEASDKDGMEETVRDGTSVEVDPSSTEVEP